MVRLLRAVAVLGPLLACGGDRFTTRASTLCTIPGGARANVPLQLAADFGPSGCAPADAGCTARVDGGTVTFTTSATICSTGTNPGGVTASVGCVLPPLAPGRYALEPFGLSLDVVADGGGATSCGRGF